MGTQELGIADREKSLRDYRNVHVIVVSAVDLSRIDRDDDRVVDTDDAPRPVVLDFGRLRPEGACASGQHRVVVQRMAERRWHGHRVVKERGIVPVRGCNGLDPTSPSVGQHQAGVGRRSRRPDHHEAGTVERGQQVQLPGSFMELRLELAAELLGAFRAEISEACPRVLEPIADVKQSRVIPTEFEVILLRERAVLGGAEERMPASSRGGASFAVGMGAHPVEKSAILNKRAGSARGGNLPLDRFTTNGEPFRKGKTGGPREKK